MTLLRSAEKEGVTGVISFCNELELARGAGAGGLGRDLWEKLAAFAHRYQDVPYSALRRTQAGSRVTAYEDDVPAHSIRANTSSATMWPSSRFWPAKFWSKSIVKPISPPITSGSLHRPPRSAPHQDYFLRSPLGYCRMGRPLPPTPCTYITHTGLCVRPQGALIRSAST